MCFPPHVSGFRWYLFNCPRIYFVSSVKRCQRSNHFAKKLSRKCFLMKETLVNLGWIQWNESLCSKETSTLTILIFVLTLEFWSLSTWWLSRSKEKIRDSIPMEKSNEIICMSRNDLKRDYRWILKSLFWRAFAIRSS